MDYLIMLIEKTNGTKLYYVDSQESYDEQEPDSAIKSETLILKLTADELINIKDQIDSISFETDAE